jgi:hypothetical protein
MIVIAHSKDPVSVSPGLGPRIILQIGRRSRGKTRLAALDIAEARVLAIALLSQADKKDEEISKMNLQARRLSR